MRIECEWCGAWIDDFDKTCPNCGGVNSHYVRQANDIPQTIEELKAWAAEMKLPLDEMRTFIGEDYKGAKAFGIYKDEKDGTFVVYKNKADGTRMIRYQGDDEAYAVNELYTKMKERVAVQKAGQRAAAVGSGASANQGNRTAAPSGNNSSQGNKNNNSKGRIGLYILIALIIIGIGSCGIIFGGGSSSGYSGSGSSYNYESNYDDYDDSYDYSDDDSYDSSDDDSSWDSGWDSDSSWDSGSDWDSGYDDWGSDW